VYRGHLESKECAGWGSYAGSQLDVKLTRNAPSRGCARRRWPALGESFRFAQALYDDKDPYKRHHRFYWNGVLSGMGNRSLVRNPVSQEHGYQIIMGSKDEAIPAFPAARLMVRGDLAQPGKEIDRAILFWDRETKRDR
jgi:hypothetical protein